MHCTIACPWAWPDKAKKEAAFRWPADALAVLLAVLALFAGPEMAEAAPAPSIERHGAADQLIVEGEPFLILGGELGNSSASSRAYMANHWERLRAMNLNTVLAPVYWELIEPQDGAFDFSSVDGLIEDVRRNHMRLVLLWFGTWKNSMSSYAPGWVKRNIVRFPRTKDAQGRDQEIISVFSEEVREADARAFAALMRHIRQVDGEQQTVIMVQVENEAGFLPLAREYGPEANNAFAGPVPRELDSSGGSWADVFGNQAEERFMAWHYARFVEAVAAAGQAEYDLPMFVNGAQGRPGVAPGDYPSGGPLSHLAKEWRLGAPSVDFIAPDIYFPNFAGITDSYAAVHVSPIFIPEANRPSDKALVANALRSIGQHKAIGFSPFAIEGAGPDDAKRIAALYAMLHQLAPEILAAQAGDRIAGIGNPVSFEGEADLGPIEIVLGPAKFTATTIDPWTPREAQEPASHGALLIWLGGEDYLVAGQGVTFTIETADGDGRMGIDFVEEGEFVEGKWRAVRRLNGDQTHQGRHVRLPPGEFGIQRLRVYHY